MNHRPQEPSKLFNKAHVTEGVRVHSSNIHMNKSIGVYVSWPPNLTEPESNPQSESEPESDQEHIAGQANHRHQFDPASVVEDITNAEKLGAIEPNNDDDKRNSGTKNMQSNIIHPLGKDSYVLNFIKFTSIRLKILRQLSLLFVIISLVKFVSLENT